MSARLFIPGDFAAVAVGADAVARALAAAGATIVRTGSRGMFWLEPLVEVETPEGRIGYGPVTEADVPGLLASRPAARAAPTACGSARPNSIPFLAAQTRLTFRPLRHRRSRSRSTTTAPMAATAALPAPCSSAPPGTVEEVTASGLRGRGGAGFPTGIKWKTVRRRPRTARNTSSATPTRATAAPTPTA